MSASRQEQRPQGGQHGHACKDNDGCHRDEHHHHSCHCCCHDLHEIGLPRLSLKDIVPRLPDYMVDEYKEKKFLSLYPVQGGGCGPQIVEFSPWTAYPGSLMVILGHGFAPLREENHVVVGGENALVIGADRHRLVVITGWESRDGDVVVTTRHGESKARRTFSVSYWPPPESDGPPFSFEGVGTGEWARGLLEKQADSHRFTIRSLIAPRTGIAKVLVVCGHPTDRSPANETSALAAVAAKCADARKFYQQASYGQLDVQFEIIGYFTLVSDFAYYYRDTPVIDGYPNFKKELLTQIWAEAAQFAVGQSKNLDDYHVLMPNIFMDTFIRAWGGYTLPNPFKFKITGVDVDLRLNHTLGTITFGDNADGTGTGGDVTAGRVAHEFGHNVVPTPSNILGEDVYPDGTPAQDFTAQEFEMMGDHDSVPLFSGFNMEGLGWYTVDTRDQPGGTPGNLVTRNWSRTTPFSEDFLMQAHGISQNTNSSRCHLVKIHVANGLDYYIEVRQQPQSAAQIFDPSIPVPSGKTGGVIVTRSVNGLSNNNQAIRSITLLEQQAVTMAAGDTAVDPLRKLKITVLDDSVQANPLVCKVRAEWAQPTSPTPGGTTDLWITPWGPGYWTPDIWIDREGDGVFDHQDASGNPIQGGDVPQLGKANQFKARVRNQGTTDASNVVASFYVNTPPGIGDSGTWTPLKTFTIPTVPAGGDIVQSADWDPSVGEHTCLQVAIVPQTGENNIANNLAQENIFTFLPASSSVPAPVELPLVVKNPLDRRELIFISIDGVPEGFYVYFPRQLLWLEAQAEQRLELLVIPLREIQDLKTKIANIRVQGAVPWYYRRITAANGLPTASTFRSTGGIQAVVSPRVGAQIKLVDPVVRDGRQFIVRGLVAPVQVDQAVRVDCVVEDGHGTMLYGLGRTDKQGGFVVSFVPRLLTRRMYLSFQAHIFEASVLAPCDSNVVHYLLEAVLDGGLEVPR